MDTGVGCVSLAHGGTGAIVVWWGVQNYHKRTAKLKSGALEPVKGCYLAFAEVRGRMWHLIWAPYSDGPQPEPMPDEVTQLRGALSCIADGEFETVERCREWAQRALAGLHAH